jgi:hypothetical protein
MTAEGRLGDELAEARAEIARLKQQVATVMPTFHKDLSLISIVPKWSRAESAAPLEEFLSNIESAAMTGRWCDEDKLRIAIVRLTEHARTFLTLIRNCMPTTSCQRLKEIFAEKETNITLIGCSRRGNKT